MLKSHSFKMMEAPKFNNTSSLELTGQPIKESIEQSLLQRHLNHWIPSNSKKALLTEDMQVNPNSRTIAKPTAPPTLRLISLAFVTQVPLGLTTEIMGATIQIAA